MGIMSGVQKSEFWTRNPQFSAAWPGAVRGTLAFNPYETFSTCWTPAGEALKV